MNASRWSDVPLRRGLHALAGAVTAAGLLAGCGGGSSAPRAVVHLDAAQVGDALHGAVVRPPYVEPPITLTDTSGTRYDIRTTGSPKVTLVYFGYTHCPDVCPTTMADIAEALRQSSAEVRRQVAVVFVTVDPRRDTHAVIREWLDRFSRNFIGLRGSLRQLIAAQRAAGLPVSKVEPNGKTIEHAAQVLAYTPDHRAHVFYTQGPSTIDDLRHDLPILVSAASSAYA